ncbi:MAG: Crp/Fnr family transcriptional regulator [Gemmatimonadaceae bacterium]
MPASPDEESPRPVPDAGATEDLLAARARERNLILRALPLEEYARLRPQLERCSVESLEVLVHAGGALEYVYFPESAIVSVTRRMGDGSLVESGTVGCEGMAGLAVLFGEPWSPAVLQGQVPGLCKRMQFAALRELLPELHVLRSILGRFTLSFLDQLGQAAACNAVHSVEQRCARWLLMAHDRVGSDEFELTHQTLSQMLGVRRASVTEVAGAFQAAGVIRYERGRVSIRQRAGLEASVCECYEIVRSNTERLLARGVGGA